MRPCQSHVPAGQVAGHLQRAGHAAVDGAGAVPAGDTEGVGSLIQTSWRAVKVELGGLDAH